MALTHTDLSTSHASKYLQQLCKHFGHKVPVEYTPDEGVIDLPFGRCSLKASDETLVIEGSAEPDQIGRLEKVISDHLERFAFREQPALSWRRGG
ncbi:MAG: DUF2218 domain-containing protein [Rhodobacteraceae bacterium]|nr:DUF2218 domain-containing protein [Paracoccaceae bacterium]